MGVATTVPDVERPGVDPSFGRVYVDPANIVFQNDPHPLPSLFTHERSPTVGIKGESGEGHGPAQDVAEAGSCFVADTGAVVCWPVATAGGEGEHPILTAFVSGMISNWIWTVTRPGWWDGQLMAFITGHCDAREMYAQLTISNGKLVDWACLEPS